MSNGRSVAARAAEDRLGGLGLTQAELAERTGLDRTTIGALLNGKNWPQPRTRAKIEVALGWPVGTLARIAAGEEPPFTPQALTADELRQLIAEAEDELAGLTTRYESTRRIIAARLQREIEDLNRQLEALESQRPPLEAVVQCDH